MRIIVKYDEVVSNELMEKAKGIKHYNEFLEIAYEYGWNEAFIAFSKTHENYNEDRVEQYLIEEFYDRIIEYVIEDALATENF